MWLTTIMVCFSQIRRDIGYFLYLCKCAQTGDFQRITILVWGLLRMTGMLGECLTEVESIQDSIVFRLIFCIFALNIHIYNNVYEEIMIIEYVRMIIQRNIRNESTVN
jgi:hypothetical protein